MGKLIIKDINQYGLNEDPQYIFMLFGLLKKEGNDYVNCTPLMKCRDYLNDVIYIQYHKLTNFPKTYGFEWKYEAWLEKKFSSKYTDVVFVVNEGVLINIKKNFLLINRLEAKLGFPLTKFYIKTDIKCFNDTWKTNKFLHVKVPSNWWANSILMSLYTLFWRLIGYNNLKDHDSSISSILKNLKHTCGNSDQGIITDIIKNEKKFWYLIENWKDIIGYAPQPITPEADDIDMETFKYTIHNGSGIQSFIQGLTRPEHAEPAVREWCKKLNEVYND